MLQRSVVLSFFFLVPLGFLAFRHGYKLVWTASVFAILGNAIILAGTAISRGVPVAATTGNILHFTALILVFMWITMPPPAFAQVPFTVRFVIGSCLGAVAFILLFFRLMGAPGFAEYVGHVLNTLSQQDARFGIMNTEMVLQGMRSILLRGGSLVACIVMFALSRQLSFFAARIIPGKTRNSSETLMLYLQRVNSLAAFRVHSTLIWIFSSSLLLVILTRRAGLEPPEILLWNVLVICVILYFAQGVGILQVFLSRQTLSPFVKLLCLVLLVFMFFSPILNMVLLVCLVLLGIAENWVPFRVSKKDNPPSTPEGEW